MSGVNYDTTYNNTTSGSDDVFSMSIIHKYLNNYDL